MSARQDGSPSDIINMAVGSNLRQREDRDMRGNWSHSRKPLHAASLRKKLASWQEKREITVILLFLLGI